MTENYCAAQKRDGSGDTCALPAGWGTDHVGEGRCKHHDAPGGAREGAGAPSDNTNAVTYGAYADVNNFYTDVLDDAHREMVDAIFTDYVEAYEVRHGDPPLGHEAELFRIAVSHGKHVYADNWAVDRPAELDSGNPVVDQEVHYTDEGTKYHKYRETVVAKAQKRLSTDRRQWLKDLGLLEDPDDGASDFDNLAAAIMEVATDGDD